MKDRAIAESLAALGLNEKEASLYLAALSLGESGMTDLAATARLNRSTAYLVFQSLEEKGLMGTFRNRRGARFVATKPRAVLHQAKERIDQLEGVLPRLDALLPKANQAPKVSFFEGAEGYFIAVRDSLRLPGSTIRHIGSLQAIHRVISADYDVEYYVPERVTRGISIRCLYFESEMTDPRIRTEAPDERREVRFLPESHRFPTSALIYGNKTAYFSSADELATVVVESEELAKAEVAKFDLLWQMAGRKP